MRRDLAEVRPSRGSCSAGSPATSLGRRSKGERVEQLDLEVAISREEVERGRAFISGNRSSAGAAHVEVLDALGAADKGVIEGERHVRIDVPPMSG